MRVINIIYFTTEIIYTLFINPIKQLKYGFTYKKYSNIHKQPNIAGNYSFLITCVFIFSVTMQVLHELNWTKMVYEPLHKFETQIMSTSNIQGYDKNTEQWSLTGALLYSVTVITTIGKHNYKKKTK